MSMVANDLVFVECKAERISLLSIQDRCIRQRVVHFCCSPKIDPNTCEADLKQSANSLAVLFRTDVSPGGKKVSR